MRFPLVSHVVRQLSGRGALDNVNEVLAERAALTARLDALTARVAATGPVPVLVADAA
jgi:hypothetical protein